MWVERSLFPADVSEIDDRVSLFVLVLAASSLARPLLSFF